MKEHSNKIIFTAIALFALGCILLIIGMVTKVSYVDGFTTGKESVSQVIKEWNDAAAISFGLLDKTNLFKLHDVWSTVVDGAKLTADTVGIGNGPLQITQADYDTIMNFNSMLNTAIAGFSFIIISIFVGIVGIVFKFIPEKE